MLNHPRKLSKYCLQAHFPTTMYTKENYPVDDMAKLFSRTFFHQDRLRKEKLKGFSPTQITYQLQSRFSIVVDQAPSIPNSNQKMFQKGTKESQERSP